MRLDLEGALMGDDILQGLAASEQQADHSHHWKITFEVFAMEADDWVFDELTVAAGPDSRVAIQRLEEHVNNPEEYGASITGFRTMDIRLLSKTDF
jgi:hypothetical protein